MLRIEEADAPQRGQDEVGVLRPRAAAVARRQDDARAGVNIRPRLPAGRPTELLIEEAHRQQGAGNARCLLGPLLAAVLGVQDHAPITHGPALPCIDEAHVVEACVAGTRVPRGLVWAGQSGSGNRQGKEHARAFRVRYRMTASVANSAIHATSNTIAAAKSQRRREGLQRADWTIVLQSHDAVAAIDVNGFAGDAVGEVAQQIKRRGAKLLGLDVTAQRRFLRRRAGAVRRSRQCRRR